MTGAVRRPPLSRRRARHRGCAAAILAIVTALAPGAAPARADRVEDGKSIVRSLSASVIEILRRRGDASSQEAIFRKLFVRHFDVPRIGRFVLGRAAWAGATARQRAEFLNLFERYIARVYTIQLRRYSGERFRIVAAGPDRRGVFVTSRIVSPRTSRSFRLKWRMRPSNGTLKVRDMVFENISMSINQRREFAAVYRRRGGTMAGLLQAMREKMAELGRR